MEESVEMNLLRAYGSMIISLPIGNYKMFFLLDLNCELLVHDFLPRPPEVDSFLVSSVLCHVVFLSGYPSSDPWF